MNDEIAALKTEIRKLSARATAARMALHDLSEELPTGWTSIPDVARTAFEAFAALDGARQRLNLMESENG